MKLVSPEVFVADEAVPKVDAAVIAALKAQALRSPRRRCRLCAHKDVSERLHEMFLVMARDSYIRPHKHIGKSESWHVIEGAADIVFFDEAGRITEWFPVASGGTCYFRVDEPRYHTQIIRSELVVVHEVTTGPFRRAETVWAPWAPAESDVPAVAAYWEQLKRDVGGR